MCNFFWRRDRDSNPGYVSVHSRSKTARSTAPTSLHIILNCKHSVYNFYCERSPQSVALGPSRKPVKEQPHGAVLPLRHLCILNLLWKIVILHLFRAVATKRRPRSVKKVRQGTATQGCSSAPTSLHRECFDVFHYSISLECYCQVFIFILSKLFHYAIITLMMG